LGGGGEGFRCVLLRVWTANCKQSVSGGTCQVQAAVEPDRRKKSSYTNMRIIYYLPMDFSHWVGWLAGWQGGERATCRPAGRFADGLTCKPAHQLISRCLLRAVLWLVRHIRHPAQNATFLHHQTDRNRVHGVLSAFEGYFWTFKYFPR
jgi:hypothetical protein